MENLLKYKIGRRITLLKLNDCEHVKFDKSKKQKKKKKKILTTTKDSEF